MPAFRAEAFREPDGQYTWVYYKDGAFQVVGGQNQTLNAAVNAMRDKIAAEPNVANALVVSLSADIP